MNIQLDLHDDIAGRDVLLVEDILDTGTTLSKLVAELRSRNPASLKLCVLLDKPDRRTQPIQADYVGFHHSRRLRGGLWPGLRAAVSQPPLHRGAETQRIPGVRAQPGPCSAAAAAAIP